MTYADKLRAKLAVYVTHHGSSTRAAIALGVSKTAVQDLIAGRSTVSDRLLPLIKGPVGLTEEEAAGLERESILRRRRARLANLKPKMHPHDAILRRWRADHV